MRVAICDDEEQYRKETKECIREYNRKIEIVEYKDGSELIQSKEKFDLIFLDIEMPELDGMTAAKRLRKKNIGTEIVFLTSYENYVYEAFDIRALQFLKKPLDKEKLFKVLRTMEKILANEEKIELGLDGEKSYVKVKDIVYIESYGDGLYIYDRFGNVYDEPRGTLKGWCERLKEKGFAQIHKSYLISMFYIERYGNSYVKLKGIDKKMEISRRRVSEFKEVFFEFVSKNGRIV